MKSVVITVAALSLLACGGAREQFTPGERATAQTFEGYTAAEYAIASRQGDLGDAKVFTRGAYRAQVNGRDRTVVHVGFVIENNSRYPLELAPDRLLLDSATIDQRVVQDLEPVRVEGPLVIQPGDEREVNAYFALPPGTSPTDVDAFRVRWMLAANGITYAQRTPFLERQEEYYYMPHYDPFYYDPFFHHPRIITHRFPYRHHGVFW